MSPGSVNDQTGREFLTFLNVQLQWAPLFTVQ